VETNTIVLKERNLYLIILPMHLWLCSPLRVGTNMKVTHAQKPLSISVLNFGHSQCWKLPKKWYLWTLFVV